VRNSILTIVFVALGISEYTLVEIDASSYTNWVYFSFSTGQVVDIDDPQNSDEWDLGLMRNHFRTNSGLSGNALGGAYVDSTATWTESWESITEVPNDAIFYADGMLNTIYDLSTHEFSEAPGSLVLETWGWVDLDNNYQFNYNNFIFFIRTANGEYVKFWPYSYYNDQDVSGHISIAYETGILNNNCMSSADVNYDNILNILDVIMMRDFIVGTNIFSDVQVCQADINFDGFVDLLDIIIVINMIFN